MRHPRPDSIRLKRLQRYFLYAVLALVFLSGVAWAYWNYLVASPGDFEMSAKTWAMKIHGAAAMAVLVLDRDALERACAIRVAGAPQSSKRIGFSECVRGFDHHWLWPLLRGRRKTACVDELDSSRHRPGFADFVADPHPSWKEDTPYGSILNEIALCVWRRRGSTSKVALLRVPTQPLMRAVAKLNLKLRTGAAYSIFTLPLWERPAFGNFSYGRNNRISA